jgi:hypothetical protein
MAFPGLLHFGGSRILDSKSSLSDEVVEVSHEIRDSEGLVPPGMFQNKVVNRF